MRLSGIPTLSLEPAISVAISQYINLWYQTAMEWGRVGNNMQSVSDNTDINDDISLEVAYLFLSP